MSADSGDKTKEEIFKFYPEDARAHANIGRTYKYQGKYDNPLLNRASLLQSIFNKFGDDNLSKLIDLTSQLSMDSHFRDEIAEICRSPDAIDTFAMLMGET